MGYPSSIRWELNNGITGTFVIDGPPQEMVEVLVAALRDQIPISVPEITAMPEILITEVTYSINDNRMARVEVWFREPDGSR